VKLKILEEKLGRSWGVGYNVDCRWRQAEMMLPEILGLLVNCIAFHAESIFFILKHVAEVKKDSF
jgi:hypothetical protein